MIKEKIGTDPASEVDDRVIDLQPVRKGTCSIGTAPEALRQRVRLHGRSRQQNSLPGAVRLWDFDLDSRRRTDGVRSGTGYAGIIDDRLGHRYRSRRVGNAQAGVPIGQQYACSAAPAGHGLRARTRSSAFRLDGSLDVLVVAPIITDLDASGGGATTTRSFRKVISTSPANTTSGRATRGRTVWMRSSCEFRRTD